MKKPWLKRYSELLAVIFLLFMIVTVYLFEVLIIRPYLIEQNYRFIPLHLLLATLILLNTCLNFYYVIRTDTSIIGIVMPSNLLPNWHYCNVCESNVPPRSHHCQICDRCILRRDHHCVFTASCVGYKNYKYFMGLLFQLSVACIYATIMHYNYVFANMKHLGWFSMIVSHFIPLASFGLGYIDMWTTICNMISVLCIIGSLFSVGLFVYHFKLLLNDQTTYERARSIRKYDQKNRLWNLKATLGDRWPLAIFLTPIIHSKLPGDGLEFPTKPVDNKPL